MKDELTERPDLESIRRLAVRRRRKVFLVGGFLRDRLLGREGVDFDFAVDRRAVDFARAVADEVGGAFVLLDEESGCGRVVRKEKGRLLTFDFADFRGKDIREDLRHRDFTINTLALDVRDWRPGVSWRNRLLSCRGARTHLRRGEIHRVSPHAFEEDPLRVLRAFSLQALWGFRIHEKTLQAIQKDKHRLRQVSPERIREELLKICASPRTAVVFRRMDRAGLWQDILPQVNMMKKVPQGTYHHLDVWRHSLETVAQLEKLYVRFQSDPDWTVYANAVIGGGHTRKALLKLGALWHDIGKPATRKREQGRISFHGHEHVGKAIVRTMARQLKLSTPERRALEDWVRWHLRPGYLSNFEKPTERAYFRYFRDTGEEAAAVAVLSLADQKATRGPATTESAQAHHDRICCEIMERFFRKKKEKPRPRLVTGHDLIRVLKLRPSPKFKMILDAVEEAQATGRISTRDQALALARKKIRESGPFSETVEK